MADKVCPGPVCGNTSPTANGIREAVCVHTKKVYDSCKSKECVRDLRVYLCRDAQELINSGSVAAVRSRSAELICVKIDVEPIKFNRGFYSVDIRYFYKIEVELSLVAGRPRIVVGLAVFDKRTILFGSEGGARIFSSHFIENGADIQVAQGTNRPTAVVEVLDPILLDAQIVPPEANCNACCCCCCGMHELPHPVCGCFEGEDLVLGQENCYQLFVTLGQFSIIRLERDTQLLMPVYDVCVPRRDCSNSGVGGEQEDPCKVFSRFEFPIEEFFPRASENANCQFVNSATVNNNTNHGGCGGCKPCGC